MKKPKSLLFLSVLFVFVSCSLEKRHYMPGYSINWKANKNNHTINNSENIVSSNETRKENAIDVNDNYPTSASNDSILITISETSIVKSEKETEKIEDEPKDIIKKKKEKTIDPEIDSEKSINLGILAFSFIVIGLLFAILVISIPTFIYILFLIAILSELLAIALFILGIIKAIKVLHYLKAHPESNPKNKNKAIIGLLLNVLILIPLLVCIVLLLASGAL